MAGDFGVAPRRAARSFSSLRMAACHASRTALATQVTRTPAVSGPSPTISARYRGLNLERPPPRAAAGLMQSFRNKAPAGTLIAARGSITANSSFEVQATSWALIRTAVYEAWMRRYLLAADFLNDTLYDVQKPADDWLGELRWLSTKPVAVASAPLKCISRKIF